MPTTVALRTPPGRAGRLWLRARLEAARRGAEVLDRKRAALLHRHARAKAEAEEARGAWREAVRAAGRWSARAGLVDGPGRLDLLARHGRGDAELEVVWSSMMGARIPSAARVAVPEPAPISALGGSSAAVEAARAGADVVRAAVRYALAERTERELADELRRTSVRARALRERWIPEHEAALARLDLALDEAQREEASRVRWLVRRQDEGRA